MFCSVAQLNHPHPLSCTSAACAAQAKPKRQRSPSPPPLLLDPNTFDLPKGVQLPGKVPGLPLVPFGATSFQLDVYSLQETGPAVELVLQVHDAALHVHERGSCVHVVELRNERLA